MTAAVTFGVAPTFGNLNLTRYGDFITEIDTVDGSDWPGRWEFRFLPDNSSIWIDWVATISGGTASWNVDKDDVAAVLDSGVTVYRLFYVDGDYDLEWARGPIREDRPSTASLFPASLTVTLPGPIGPVAVPVKGPVGPIGPQGVPGDPGAALAYSQAVTNPTTLVQLNHGLTFKPAGVVCLDTGVPAVVVEYASISYPLPGVTEVTFGFPFVGTVYLS
jgi:hypothetical protein